MSIQSDWWKQFYSGLWLQVPQQSWWSAEQTRVEADFIERLLHLAPPAKILDAPCGDGPTKP